MDEVTEIDAIVWNQDNKHYRDMSDDTLDRIIKAELNNIKKTFVSIGFFLRVADEKRIYEKKGYKTLWAYAYDTYGISRSYASRYMQINRRFSKGGSSTILDEKYQDFGKSQLQEMIALPDDKLEGVTPDMKVLDIRHLNPKSKSKPEPDPEPEETPEEDIPGQMVIEDYPEVLPKEQPLEETQGKCITGQSGSGRCGSAAWCNEDVRCCAACDKDCSIRCGWIAKPEPCATSHKTEEVEVIEAEAVEPAPDVPEVENKTVWPEVLADMPRYKSLAVKDYLEDAEQELKTYVTLNEAEKDERRKIPERTMEKEYMRVEGLRLLLALVERMERTENDGEE